MGDDAQRLHHLFPALSASQRDKFAALPALYREWNAKINLISRKDMDAFFERHVLHSLSIALHTGFSPGRHVIDIGTGGGFPGVPLAILFPETQFTLVDSTAKKINAVNAICHELGLINAQAVHARAERVDGTYSCAVSRAVARLSLLVRYCTASRMAVDRLYCLKGGDLRAEIAELKRFPVEVFDLKDKLPDEFFETKKLVSVDFQGLR